jgi:hypothetical protein
VRFESQRLVSRIEQGAARTRKYLQAENWVVDDAVCRELLSASNSLITRENTGNFRDFGCLGVDLQLKKADLLSSI